MKRLHMPACRRPVAVLLLLGWATVAWALPAKSKGRVTVYPAPAGEALSQLYRVWVEGRQLPVYPAKVGSADLALRYKGMDDKHLSASVFSVAAFGTFDMQGPVQVTVQVPDQVKTAKILPSSAGIRPRIRGRSLTFTLPAPRHLTIEINGEVVQSLHLFANPPEPDAPRPDDPNVIYFGPGIHQVSHLVVGDNKTVYVAGGAVVRAVIDPQEKYKVNTHGLRTYAPTFELRGHNITFRGRGIIDGSSVTTHGKHMIFIRGADVKLEGVILRDASTWTVPIRQSDRVQVSNVKLLGYRANSDGIDICNSRDVTVDNCFIRTLDDLVVIKTDKDRGPAQRIQVRDCVLWNQVAHALSIGAEISDNIDDVLFTNCDIIHDQGREWTLRIYQNDAGHVGNVRFENIRIEESKRCISLWIGKGYWSRDAERGHIQDVVFRNIQAAGSPLAVELVGFDAVHAIRQVLFEQVMLNGQPLRQDHIKTNDFVRDLVIKSY